MKQKVDTDKALYGTGLGVMDMAAKDDNRGPLSSRCIVAPYSTLNTRDAFWLDRRRAWLGLGIKSELGRDSAMTYGVPTTLADGKKARITVNGAEDTGTSVFDPMVCELAYMWWSAPGQVVWDPFAGGSVRGIVASVLGRKYVGFELRAEQVQANNEQALALKQKHGPLLQTRPIWVPGDSLVNVPAYDGEADMIFSCPPYGNLEVYSDDPADISNRTHEAFLEGYRAIVAAAVAKLKPNRFVVWVVANYRPKGGKGKMVDFVGDTVRAFEDAGATYYNDIILINAVGTGALRANTNFLRGHRKVVKLHQNILVFVKGDPALAAAELPELVNVEPQQ